MDLKLKNERETRRAEVRKRLAARAVKLIPKLIPADPPPRFDEVFIQGTRVLNEDVKP